MPNIYILNDMKFEGIKNIPLLKIKYIKSQIDLNRYDYLLFTSKNGVYAIDSFNQDWKNIPSYVIAPKTADVVRKSGGKVEYCSNCSNGNEFASDIKEALKNKKVLYIRAQKVVSDLYKILKNNNVQIDELIAYKTSCNDEVRKIELEDNAIIIFSSPSTIKCFFKHYEWRDNFQAVAIGETTASFLPKEISVLISPTQAIEECIKLAKRAI